MGFGSQAGDFLFGLGVPEGDGFFEPAFAGEAFTDADAVFYAGVLDEFVGNTGSVQGGVEEAAVIRVHAAVAAAHPQEGGWIIPSDLLLHAGLGLQLLGGVFAQQVVPAAGVGFFLHGHHRVAQDNGAGFGKAEFGIAHGLRSEAGGKVPACGGAPDTIALHIQLPVLSVVLQLPDRPGQVLLRMGVTALILHPVIEHEGVIAHAIQLFHKGPPLNEAADPAVTAAGADDGNLMSFAVPEKVPLQQKAVGAVGVSKFLNAADDILFQWDSPLMSLFGCFLLIAICGRPQVAPTVLDGT